MKDNELYLKVSYFHKKTKLLNKKFIYRNSEYEQFIQKITKEFSLSKKMYYHLYYQQNNYKITISNQDHFTIFLNQKQRSQLQLFLEPTTNQDKHYLEIEKQQKKDISLQDVNKNLTLMVEANKSQMQNDLKEWKKKMQEKVRQQCEIPVANLISRLKDKRQSQAIHKNLSCDNCKVKKDIIGIRYQCAICDYNLCQTCQILNEHNHAKNHPFIRIKDQSQKIVYKDNKLQLKLNKVSEKKKSLVQTFIEKKTQKNVAYEQVNIRELQQLKRIPQLDQKIQALMTLFQVDRQAAILFIRKNAKMTRDELIDLYMSKL